MKKEILGCAVRWGLLLVLLAFLSVITASGWVVAGCFLMLLLPLVSWGVNVYIRKHIKVRISVPVTAGKNAVSHCTVSIRNEAHLPVLHYFLRIEVINDLTGERKTETLIGSAGAKKQNVHSLLLQSEYCGRLYIYVKSFTLMDYFGLLPMKAAVKAGARSTVIPDLFTMDVEMTVQPASSDEGNTDRKGEDRSEVFQIREYQPGDDVRQIHWKLSSKLGNLLYKEGSLPESRSLLVFWDKRICGTPVQMDALAETVSSASSGLMQKGIPFCLCWTEQDELQFQEISDENTLLQTIPALVKNTGNADCRLPDLNQFNRVLYFGLLPEEQMQNDERVCFILCSETDIPGAIVFSARNYQETMQRLEV